MTKVLKRTVHEEVFNPPDERYNDLEKANEYSMVKDFIAKPLSDKVLVDLFAEIEAEDASNSSTK